MNGAQQVPQGMPQGGFPGGPPVGRMGGGLLPGGPVTGAVAVALLGLTLIVLAIAFYQLFKRAGFSGAIGLLMLVPLVNLGVALYLAFAEWPVLAELAGLKLQLGSMREGAPLARSVPPTPGATQPPGAAPAGPMTSPGA